ncbi:hypothetical protein Sste5346_008736 [Sporothrix stenoceras]|uniref:Adenine DNA glycosylase n=1 Tax=Sporothrix stenoceras TaxID=5173 RepID=A0ABR3YN36_9PEZI
MARTQRASAAAAAKKIAVQAEEHDDVTASSGDAKRTTRRTSTTTTLPNRSAKRKRESESPEYDDGAGQEEADDDEDDVEDDDGEEEDEDDAKPNRSRPPPQKKLMVETPVATKVKKARRPTNSAAAFALKQRLFLRSTATNDTPPACCPPERVHSVDYHRPLLLDGATGRKARRALLAWYDSVSATRGMPWRRPWMDPAVGLEGKDETARTELARRAYQVWISEVMAQQTRIAVVIGYWTRWMARWPTLEDLAAALDSEVFQEWSGLGYYSRASRVHEAAILVTSDPTFRGLLPPDVATLESRIPGVGRYTAGAVSAIVYGRAAPMVDGNVIRVLSRQLGVFADSKAEKALVDLLWAAAEALVKAVARDGPKEGDEVADDVEDADVPVSDRPGRWGQALMELGSTVCAPKPDCAACPISSTCRTYAEGLALHERNTKGTVPLALVKREDGETDPCDLCEQFPELDEEEAAALAKADKKEEKKGMDAKKDKKVAKSPFFDVEDAVSGVSKEALSTIVTHARTFPLRRPKKPVREVETLVCAIRYAGKGQNLYLLHQRPAKGLLASLWQLPSYDLPAPLDSKAARRKEAEAFVTRWLADVGSSADGAKKGTNAKVVKCTAATTPLRTTKTKELGSVPWLFSHLRQTMHIYVFDVVSEGGGIVKPSNLPTPASCCWASETEAEKTYSMGTGMRKCWTLVKDT